MTPADRQMALALHGQGLTARQIMVELRRADPSRRRRVRQIEAALPRRRCDCAVIRVHAAQVQRALSYAAQRVSRSFIMARILDAIGRSPITPPDLVEAVYADDPNGGPLTAHQIVELYLWKLRRMGYPIIYTSGHYMLRRP